MKSHFFSAKVVLSSIFTSCHQFPVYSLLSNSFVASEVHSSVPSPLSPPPRSLFTATWLHLNKRLTPAYRIKLISTKQGLVQEGRGGWWGCCGGGGKGKTTTGGQERSTARRGHNGEQAAGCLGVRGLLGGWCWLTGGGDHLFSAGGCEVGRGDRQSRANLVGVLWGQTVSSTMFGCAGSEVAAAIVGACRWNSISAGWRLRRWLTAQRRTTNHISVLLKIMNTVTWFLNHG